MGRVSRAVALAAAAAAGAEAFSTPPGITLRGAGGATAAATHRRAVAGVSMQDTSQVSRRDLFSVAVAAAALVGSGAPSNAEMLKAKCTVQSCPDAPEGAYKIDKLEVKAGKYTGKGYQFDKPTEDYFKRVQVFDRITARPGSVLLRDKKNPDIAIFGNVEQIKNADFSWKPTIIEAYTKNFGDKFKLISQSGPTKTGGVDMYTFEYVVETELGSKYEKVHFVSTFAASAENVYIINAQAKESDWPRVGEVLASCAQSLTVNE